MQTVYERCCGIDVHKKLIVACFRNGKKAELRKFDTLLVISKNLPIGSLIMIVRWLPWKAQVLTGNPSTTF